MNGQLQSFVSKISGEDLQVEIEILPESLCKASFHNDFEKEISEIDNSLNEKKNKIENLSQDIDRLSWQGDKIDLIVAASCGLFTGLIDSFFIGDAEHAQELGKKPVNEFVEHFAKKHGYTGDGGLEGSINFLENKFQSPTDNIWKGDNVVIKKASRSVEKTKIWTASHHLDDYSHHPTLVGLLCSILTQFTKVGYFQNKEGTLFELQITDEGLIGTSFWGKIGSGIINWFGHLVSDMAGASSTAGAGMGIPGPFLSLAKELAALPGMRDSSLPKRLNQMFTSRNLKLSFDLRCEIGQSIPVLINICLVTVFYMIRRTIWAIKAHKDGTKISPKDIIPSYNRTYARMLTIASGVFVATDMADAAIRSAAKSAGNPAIAFADFVTRINIVGIGQFALALGKDVRMGLKRERLRNKRMALYGEVLSLTEAKMAYECEGVWVEAKDTQQAIEAMEATANTVFDELARTWNETISDLADVTKKRDDIEKNNPGLLAWIGNELD